MALRSRIEETLKLCNEDDELNPSDAHTLLNDIALHLQTRVQNTISDLPFLESQDFDAYLDNLKEELNKVEAESTNVANQIQLLTKNRDDDINLLESRLEEIKCSLDYITSKDQMTTEAGEGIHSPMLPDDYSTLTIVNQETNLEELELENKIDEMKSTLKSLQDLQCKVQWFDAFDQIEDALTGLKVLAFDENCIRLSMRTYMPKLEGLSYLERVEDISDVAELNHELLIEVFEGTIKLKNFQGFPNDIYVNDIVDTAKSVSKSSLQWFVRKVQDRIILSILRRLVVKDANKSRYSLEYLDKDEIIVAHMAGGIDAYIKLSHGWPLFGSPLKLISVKGSDNLKSTSFSFHCKVEKLANSLDTHIRQNISSFVDAVEKVLKEQLQLDLQPGSP